MWFRKYHQDKHSLTCWTFAVTLTLNTVIPFFNRTLWLKMLYYQTKFGCNLTSSLEDTQEMVIFRLYISPCCDLDIEQNEPIFLHDTLWLMRLHYHNRFGNKIFCGSDNTVGTVFTDILNLHCDLDLECSRTHVTTEYSSLWSWTIKPSLVANRPAD